MIRFITVKPQMGDLFFSRRKVLHVVDQHSATPTLPNTQTMRQVVFGDRRHDVLLLTHVSQIPKDVQEAFSAAERINSQQYQSLGPRFSEDLSRCCDFIGFATSLEVKHEGRMETIGGLTAIITKQQTQGLENSRESNTRDVCLASVLAENVIGEESNVIFVSVREKESDLGRLSLAVLIAREIGTIKMFAQAKRLGFPEENLSLPMVKFFADAYTYNFILSLLAAADETKPDNAAEVDTDVRRIVEWREKSFRSMVENYLGMTRLQQMHFIGAGEVHGLVFGLPVFIDFVGAPQLWDPQSAAEVRN